MKDIILDTLLDAAKMIPFLFVAFLIIELVEHNFSKKTKKIIGSSGKFGPLFGSLLGAFPQCGFSVIATNLYVTRIITLGTLISIYLSTSDEMIPILLSHNVDLIEILKIVGLKVVIGMIMGFLIDLIYRKNNKSDFKVCDECECDCDESIIKASIIHTLKTILFIMIISFGINVLFEFVAEDVLKKLFVSNIFLGPLFSSLIGLIPNCGSSIMITELYLNEVISFGTTMAGLLTGSGVALLVLFKSNNNFKENIFILGTIYLLGVMCGIVINLIGGFL